MDKNLLYLILRYKNNQLRIYNSEDTDKLTPQYNTVVISCEAGEQLLKRINKPYVTHVRINIHTSQRPGHITIIRHTTHLEHISILQHITHLELFKSRNTQSRFKHIICLTPLMTLKNLRSLSLNNVTINPKHLAQLTQLESLECYHVSDLQLNSLINLKHLRICSGGLYNMSFIKYMPKLQTMDLRHNKIKDLPDMKHMTNLRKLCLSNNQLTSISALQDVPLLSSLQLDNNEEPLDIRPLRRLTNLKNLSICQLETNDIETICQLHQRKCKIQLYFM